MPVKLKAPWCVFVSGSRDLGWDAHYDLVLRELTSFKEISRLEPTLIHGSGPGRNGEPGCDRLAHRAGQELGFRVHGFPALWDLQGKRAGPVRNKLCAEILLAHFTAGYAPAFLGFSTGGPGTEGAHALMVKIRDQDSVPVQIKKIDIVL